MLQAFIGLFGFVFVNGRDLLLFIFAFSVPTTTPSIYSKCAVGVWGTSVGLREISRGKSADNIDRNRDF